MYILSLMKSYDVVIVGAGPGSLKAAEFLAKNNKSVVVLEKGKIIGKKVCAGGITLKNFKFGLPKSIMEREFKRIIIHTPLQSVEIEQDEPIVYTTSRIALGQYMATEAKKAGAEIMRESPVKKIDENTVTIYNSKNNEEEKFRFRHLIGGDGSASVVRQHLGLKSHALHLAYQYIIPNRTNNSANLFKDLEVFVDANKFGPGYGWIFPYTDTASIGSGTDLASKMQKHYPAAKMRDKFQEWFTEKFDKKFNFKEKEFQAHTITYGYQGHQFGNKYLIGDAAGFSSSLTAEGIYQSILSGIEVAKQIVDPTYNCPEIQRLIQIKKKEDRYYHLFSHPPFVRNFFYELVGLLMKNKSFSSKVLAKINRY